MHPIKQLQKLLTPRSTNNGKVVANHNGTLILATQYGTRSIAPNSGDVTKYSVGDTVKLINGQIVGKHSHQPTVYIL